MNTQHLPAQALVRISSTASFHSELSKVYQETRNSLMYHWSRGKQGAMTEAEAKHQRNAKIPRHRCQAMQFFSLGFKTPFS